MTIVWFVRTATIRDLCLLLAMYASGSFTASLLIRVISLTSSCLSFPFCKMVIKVFADRVLNLFKGESEQRLFLAVQRFSGWRALINECKHTEHFINEDQSVRFVFLNIHPGVLTRLHCFVALFVNPLSNHPVFGLYCLKYSFKSRI